MRACQVKSRKLKKSNVLTWHYLCHQCKAHFDVPVPRGPTEERALRCLECGSKDIERVETYGCAIAPPGG